MDVVDKLAGNFTSGSNENTESVIVDFDKYRIEKNKSYEVLFELMENFYKILGIKNKIVTKKF